MNRPLLMPLATITCCHSGWVSRSGNTGSDPMAVGYTTISAPPSE